MNKNKKETDLESDEIKFTGTKEEMELIGKKLMDKISSDMDEIIKDNDEPETK